MKIKFMVVVFLLGFSMKSFTQCAPDPMFTLSPVPGVYPPNIPVPGIPFVGIDDGQVNNTYNQILTLIQLEDTLLDIDFLLNAIDPTIVSTMNSLGISTVMTLDVNHTTYDVIGLPNNLSYACNNTTCQYLSCCDGCISITGVPSQTGLYSIDISMTLNVQIPSIPNPVPGMPPIFSGSSVDLPTFNVQQYDLTIDAASDIYDKSISEIALYPNPSSSISTLMLNQFSDVEIYNVLGDRVYHGSQKKGALELNKSYLGEGIFFIAVMNDVETKNLKLIIE
tara:strand:- start:16 stop:855 length:840 start_codon:yes stop_codon:yes gene_type:complete